MFNIYFPSRLYLRKGILTQHFTRYTWMKAVPVSIAVEPKQIPFWAFVFYLPCLLIFSHPCSYQNCTSSQMKLCVRCLIFPPATQEACHGRLSVLCSLPREREHLHSAGRGSTSRARGRVSEICFGPCEIRNMESRGLNGLSQVTHS